MRMTVMVGFMSVIGCSGGGGASSGPPPDLTGVWAVTMRYQDGSCPDLTAGSQASMWTVNRGGDGAYAITVQGDDKMPTLTGKEDGAAVVLVGLADSYPATSTQWRMTGSGSELTGRALQTRSSPKAYTVHTRFGDSEKDAMCAVVWSVTATKQGK